MNNKKIITISLSLVILFFFLGFFLGRSFLNKKVAESFNDGWSSAEKRLKDLGFMQEQSEEFQVKSISGVVQKINGSNIEIKIKPINPFDDPEFDSRIINLNQDTVLEGVFLKNQEQLQLEIEELSNTDNNLLTPDSPDGRPSLYYTKDISLDDISVGKQITVYSSLDIRKEKNIIAEKIAVGF